MATTPGFATITDSDIFAESEADTIATLFPSHPSQRSSVTVLTLSNDNPSKTTLHDESVDRDVYNIRVNFDAKRPVTEFRHLNEDGSDGEIFGRLQWHDFWPDQVSFKGGKMVRKSSFFSSAGMYSFAVSFRDDRGRKYTWKGLGSGLQLELLAEDNWNPKVPIAQFQKTRYDYSTQPATAFPAILFMTPRAVEVKDLVVFTFFVLEKARRTKEASEGNRADAIKAAALGGASIGDGVGAGVKKRDR